MLVVTRLDDATADLVIAELNQRAVPVVRLDPGDFPMGVRASASFDDSGMAGTMRTLSRAFELKAVRSVYWRRPNPYASSPGLREQDARWCLDQARYGIGGILASLPLAHYVNHPWRNRDAEYKPAQLATAARCGLRIPPTLVTSDPCQAREFAARYAPVLYKPLWNTDYTGEDMRARTVWIDDVPPEAIDSGVSRTAHLFQQRVRKEADIRLTVVGDQFFAVRVDGSPGVDWRRHYDVLSYTPIGTPPHIRRGVRSYLQAFGLVYGALDFGLDADGRWWLYECNPNGQWAWFPDTICGPIAEALADQLAKPGADT
ncbi:ATP-grasp ribosomal peptide maturase [Streptomyces montanisoli]|uniref:ATP-grasp ribosomal peptide maturase n=1 Tax=Streptomyces montanisoli TaxID=2798581 RepID=UPI0027DDC310|nr:ATP-grasp ribosomal peptide maturase [Streptomyces montanisoli]